MASTKGRQTGYATDDLVYIHDAGFNGYALTAAPTLLALLRQHGIRDGLVVDLGSGTGRWAAKLAREGYDCIGYDQSPAMTRFAKRAVPGVRFRTGSLFDVKLPKCRAVTSMGECLNYRFNASQSTADLRKVFTRVFDALPPGGVFIFDIATPARSPKKKPRVFRNEGKDWAIVSVTTAAPGGLRRDMTFFRKHGDFYRRGTESHVLRLYPVADVLKALRGCGFRARRLELTGFPGVAGMAWILAEKI